MNSLVTYCFKIYKVLLFLILVCILIVVRDNYLHYITYLTLAKTSLVTMNVINFENVQKKGGSLSRLWSLPPSVSVQWGASSFFFPPSTSPIKLSAP